MEIVSRHAIEAANVSLNQKQNTRYLNQALKTELELSWNFHD